MKCCPSLLPFIIIKGRVLFPYWGFETFESHPNLFPSSQKHSSVVCGKNHSPAQSSLRLAGVSRRRRQGLDGDGKFHLASIVRAGPRQQRGLLGAEGVRIPLSSVEGCPLGSAGRTRLCLRIVFLHRTPAHPLLHGRRLRCRQHAGRTGDAAWPWTSTFSGVHHLLLPWTPVPTQCPNWRGGRAASRSHPSAGCAGLSSAPSRCAQQGRAAARG